MNRKQLIGKLVLSRIVRDELYILSVFNHQNYRNSKKHIHLSAPRGLLQAADLKILMSSNSFNDLSYLMIQCAYIDHKPFRGVKIGLHL